MGNNFFKVGLGLSSSATAYMAIGIFGVILFVILGFLVYKYVFKSSVDKDDDDETFYDEDRAIINENRGKIKNYI